MTCNKGWLTRPRTVLNQDCLRDVVPLAGEDACGRRGRRPSETQATVDCYFALFAFFAAKFLRRTSSALEKTFGRQQAGSLLGKFFQV